MTEQKIQVDLSEQKKKIAEQQVAIANAVVSATNLAEWIFYDCYYNCDHLAVARTGARLRMIEAEHGPDVVFGVLAYWSLRGYWKMRDAFKTRNVPFKPDLKPNPEEVQQNSANGNYAYVQGVQFYSTMAHENALTAKDIWDQAYSQGHETWLVMANVVLLSSLSTQHNADSFVMGASEDG